MQQPGRAALGAPHDQERLRVAVGGLPRDVTERRLFSNEHRLATVFARHELDHALQTRPQAIALPGPNCSSWTAVRGSSASACWSVCQHACRQSRWGLTDGMTWRRACSGRTIVWVRGTLTAGPGLSVDSWQCRVFMALVKESVAGALGTSASALTGLNGGCL